MLEFGSLFIDKWVRRQGTGPSGGILWVYMWNLDPTVGDEFRDDLLPLDGKYVHILGSVKVGGRKRHRFVSGVYFTF